MPRLRSSTALLLLGLSLLLQLGLAAPLHLAHGAGGHEASYCSPSPTGGEGERDAAPEPCHCDLCLSARALDPASASGTPPIGLGAGAFASGRSATNRLLPSSPPSGFLARGPPSHS